MTSKEAKERYGVNGDYLTIGRLKKELEKYSDDTLVVSQRIEDRYYEGVDISGITGTLADGTSGILPLGSKASGWSTIKKPDGIHPEHDNEYTPVWGVCHYKDDTDCLFLDLHY